MLIDNLICSFRNLRRKKFRSILTISSIAIGVTSVVLIGSIGEIGKATINQELSSLGIGSITVSSDKKFTSQKITQQDLELIRTIPNVESATPVVVNYSSIKMRGLVANSVVWGTDQAEHQIVSLTPQYGRMISQPDIAGAANVCVVDSNVAQLFYKRDNIVGKTVDIMIGGGYVTFEIIGVASSGGSLLQNMVGDMIPSFVYIPYTTLQRYAGDSEFEQVAVTLSEDTNIPAVSTQITKMVNRNHQIERGFKADNISGQKETLNNVLNIVTTILSTIAAVSLIVAGLGIMTIMIVSVNERTREIGIKKSIGATGGMILAEFLIEAFAISLIGSIAGLCLGIAIVWVGCKIVSVAMSLNLTMLISSVILSVGIGVVFGAYPAFMAAKLKPVDALRME